MLALSESPGRVFFSLPTCLLSHSSAFQPPHYPAKDLCCGVIDTDESVSHCLGVVGGRELSKYQLMQGRS